MWGIPGSLLCKMLIVYVKHTSQVRGFSVWLRYSLETTTFESLSQLLTIYMQHLNRMEVWICVPDLLETWIASRCNKRTRTETETDGSSCQPYVMSEEILNSTFTSVRHARFSRKSRLSHPSLDPLHLLELDSIQTR